MQEDKFTYKGHQIEIVYAGHGWFDFYIDSKPWGCARAADVSTRIEEVIALKAAK